MPVINTTYVRLIRLHKPVPILLLYFPCVWSLLITDCLSLRNSLLFLLGSFATRSLGCIYNDYVDRNIDSQVERTKERPICSKSITNKEIILISGLFTAVLILCFLPLNSFSKLLSLIALALTLIYPWTKRFTSWAQLFLGIAFNFGVLISWSETSVSFGLVPLCLYVFCVLWTVGYDTYYACQDLEDDVRVGVKSLAIKYASSIKMLLYCLWTLMTLIAWILLYKLRISIMGAIFFNVAMAFLYWQTYKLDSVKDYVQLFQQQVYFGGLVTIVFFIKG